MRRVTRGAVAVLVVAVALASASASRAEAPAPAPAPAPVPADGADRLQLIVAPTRLRPGESVNVRVADTLRQGGVTGRICARAAAAPPTCRDVRLAPGQVRLRTRLRLPRAGTWTVTLRSPAMTAIVERRVDVRPQARYRVLVTGDSMVLGIIDVLARTVRRTGGALTGDPHIGTGITRPELLPWPLHARASVRRTRPDATVVFLGAAGDIFPLKIASGEKVGCCVAEWIEAYAGEVRGMMRTYLRQGSGIVYWVLLPAPRDPRRVELTDAINAAIERAAAGFPDGVAVVDLGPAISPGNRYRETAIVGGRRVAVRAADGIHLANAGIHIASRVILRAMRRDGLATL